MRGFGAGCTGLERLRKQEDSDDEEDDAEADNHEVLLRWKASSAALPSEHLQAPALFMRVGLGVAFQAPLPVPASPKPVARSRNPVRDC